MELNIEMKQAQILSEQQIQSMKILQMNRQELLNHINENIVENPILDVNEIFKETENRELIQKLKWLESEDTQNRYYYKAEAEDSRDTLMNVPSPVKEETLLDFIKIQLDSIELSEHMRKICEFVAANLSDSGYLEEEKEVLAKCLDVPADIVSEAVRIIKSLDPAGVGAADMSECLVLQLERMNAGELPRLIAANYLEELGKNHFGHIAKELKVTVEKVRAAVVVIKSLDPKPGSKFSTGEQAVYVRPDVIIVKFHDYFEILVGDYEMPSLTINRYYLNLLESSGDNEVKVYLGDMAKRAKWLINAIGQRRATLLKCTQAILNAQESFFKGESDCLQPLTMADISDMIGMHESTVSRAVKGKYLQCSKGVFPISFFFSRRLGSSGTTSTAQAKKALEEIVEREDKTHPLSDTAIMKKLEERDIKISRRTVAKYRMELSIPNACGRKNV